MLKIGKVQTLHVVSKVDFGVYLAEEGAKDEKVLLPRKYVPANTQVGDSVEVFLYKDSEDRLIATTLKPLVTLDSLAKLKVVQVTKIGAFLDWGLEKDLFLPFRQQTYKVAEGEQCLVSLYIDKSKRLCATMKVYEYLQKDAPYEAGDEVEGTIYEVSEQFGAFVAVDDRYSALIPKREVHGVVRAGDVFRGRVARVHEDGKLDVSPTATVKFQMDVDAQKIMEALDEFAGVLPFNDKASPEVIDKYFGMSKAAFKRAVGRLYKMRRVEITETAIRAIPEEEAEVLLQKERQRQRKENYKKQAVNKYKK